MKCFYGQFEDEILSLSEEDYDKLFFCNKCSETMLSHFERFPTTDNGNAIGNFMTFRCLSCGAFCSLSKNYQKTLGVSS